MIERLDQSLRYAKGVLQRRQLEEGTRQLKESTRAIDLEAFVRVHDTLNSTEGLAARAHLQAMAQWRDDSPLPFNRGRQTTRTPHIPWPGSWNWSAC